ncbi:MAG: hypothetical protein KF909_14265, partial [Rhodocyclaceae bacterium]|nr:hypothetical protein [Rhodocyclaceae bacterium]
MSSAFFFGMRSSAVSSPGHRDAAALPDISGYAVPIIRHGGQTMPSHLADLSHAIQLAVAPV